MIICDTSFMHETHNGTDRERVVLIMRHFHPEVTPLERRAVQFLYDCLDSPSIDGVKAAQAKAAAALAGGGTGGKAAGRSRRRKGKAAAPSKGGGKGFGQPAA